MQKQGSRGSVGLTLSTRTRAAKVSGTASPGRCNLLNGYLYPLTFFSFFRNRNGLTVCVCTVCYMYIGVRSSSHPVHNEELIPWLGRGLPCVRDLCEFTRRPNLPLQGVRPYGLID